MKQVSSNQRTSLMELNLKEYKNSLENRPIKIGGASIDKTINQRFVEIFLVHLKDGIKINKVKLRLG